MCVCLFAAHHLVLCSKTTSYAHDVLPVTEQVRSGEAGVSSARCPFYVSLDAVSDSIQMEVTQTPCFHRTRCLHVSPHRWPCPADTVAPCYVVVVCGGGGGGWLVGGLVSMGVLRVWWG